MTKCVVNIYLDKKYLIGSPQPSGREVNPVADMAFEPYRYCETHDYRFTDPKWPLIQTDDGPCPFGKLEAQIEELKSAQAGDCIGRDEFVELARPAIYEWFQDQPISSETFVFDPSDCDPLAVELWRILKSA